MEQIKTVNDITIASHEDLIGYALKVTAERNALKAENAALRKSDASKEQSSIDYYCKFRKLKDENKELKARLEKAVELKYPCNVGDTVFVIRSKTSDCRNYFIREGVCSALRVSKNEIGHFTLWVDLIKDNSVFDSNFDRVFLTREAAEARLKELRGEE